MGEVEFEPVEAGSEGAACGIDEIQLYSADIVERHCLGHFGKVGSEGLRRGGDRWPAAFVFAEVGVAFPGSCGAALSAGMCELDAGGCAVGFDEAGDSGVAFDVFVEVEAGALRADAAFRCNGCCFDDDKSGATDGSGAEVDEVPVVWESVFGGVLAHG